MKIWYILEPHEEVEVHVRFVAKDENGGIPAIAVWTYATNASDVDSDVPGGGKVGDEVKFSIDLQRPTVQFVGGVKLEGGDGTDFPADSTLIITTLRGGDAPISGEDNARVLMIPAKEIDTRVEGVGALTNAAGAYTGIAESILKVFQDSALVTIELGRADVRASLPNEDISANDFEGNNVKFYLLAFTADDAGNLANAAYFTSVLADATAEPPVVVNTSPTKYTVDSTLPVVDIVTPQAGEEFTGKAETTGQRDEDGDDIKVAYIDTTKGSKRTTSDGLFAQNALEISVGEKIDSLLVEVGESKIKINGKTVTFNAGKDTVAYDVVGYKGADGKQDAKADDYGMTAQAGDGVDVTVTVWDDVGNKSKPAKVAGVTFDNVPLGISDIFPGPEAVK